MLGEDTTRVDHEVFECTPHNGPGSAFLTPDSKIVASPYTMNLEAVHSQDATPDTLRDGPPWVSIYQQSPSFDNAGSESWQESRQATPQHSQYPFDSTKKSMLDIDFGDFASVCPELLLSLPSEENSLRVASHSKATAVQISSKSTSVCCPTPGQNTINSKFRIH